MIFMIPKLFYDSVICLAFDIASSNILEEKPMMCRLDEQNLKQAELPSSERDDLWHKI